MPASAEQLREQGNDLILARVGLMWELLYIASGLRLPIVMPNVNRSFGTNQHSCDHGDSMGKDSRMDQIFSENAQSL